MTKQEIQQQLEAAELRLKNAEFDYSVSSWSSGPSWRERISQIKAEIRDLEKALEAADA